MIELQIPYEDVIFVFEEDVAVKQLLRWSAYYNDGANNLPKKGELIDDGTIPCDTENVLYVTTELLQNIYEKIYAI